MMMDSKTRYIQVRVSPEQYERIRNNAQAKGFKTVSSFIRNILLEKDLLFEQKFGRMYEIIVRKLGKI